MHTNGVSLSGTRGITVKLVVTPLLSLRDVVWVLLVPTAITRGKLAKISTNLTGSLYG